jgi:hypothetical protein
MPESSWWKEAVESAIQESNVVEEKIGLARMAILERLVAPANGKGDEDELFGALDTLRALEWERLSSPSEQIEFLVG